MPTMIRSKKSQKIVNALIGKPDAMKRRKETRSEKERKQKVAMSDYYRRSYGI